MSRPSASEDAFRAIADPTRRAIIDMLAQGPRSAGEIAASFETCQSTVSEHLAVLRRAAIVTYEQQDGRRIYNLTPSPLREVAAWSAAWSSADA
jgi:DNA-binding transcriptional ArsR family regulator